MMKYIIQSSILQYLFESKLITSEEFYAAEKIIKDENEKNFKKDLTNRKYHDILLTVDKKLGKENKK